MKKFLIAVSLAAMTLPTIAAAEPYRPQHAYQRSDHRSFEVNGHRYEAQRGPAWHAPRNYRPHRWMRNERLPADYRRVAVTDYRRRHLPPPARGERWVRVDHDAVLVGVASGVIGAVIANAFAD